MTWPIPDWLRAYGGPYGKGVLKRRPEDFQVEEVLGFEPSGDGEHVFLWVEKRELNTEQAAEMLARFANVSRGRIGYAGLKDRHGVTCQWFSVHLPGRPDLPWHALDGDTIRIRQCTRNRRKLKRGALRGNRFRLCLRALNGDRERMETVLARIKAQGMPNYFGPQRFGREGGNLSRAKNLLTGQSVVRNRHLRSLYLSAARSFLFNQVLAVRIEQDNWHTLLPGDWLMFDGGKAGFLAELPDADIRSRVAALQLHPTGPLWGREGERATLDAGAIESRVIEACPKLARGLENAGVKGMRRPFRVRVGKLDWTWRDSDLALVFELPSGAYATSLVRELIETENSGG
ncbi:MAG: tRNA pseudouridine(13) synthase TruD [Methylohalobius sp. ZOD2]